ncbi:hypothetical protein Tco_0827583, partial [Tanacetum coccineum]
MVPPNNLGPDLACKPVNETLYRGMIGSLMYLTTSRPIIQFSTYLCVRYQANPKESHLIAIKIILMYLKGTPSLGLCYPKCSGFDLKGYLNLDYVGCNMDRKSTSGACQILGGKMVCWSAKKQQSVAMSSSKAEYVADAREFWCTAVVSDPNPPIDDSEARPLKEFIIKFTVKNGQRPLTLNYKTFCEATGLDYSSGQYVNHHSTEVIKVLGGNYSSTEQLNSIQQLLVFSLLTRTKIDIGEIIFSDLVTRLMAKSR